MLGPQQVQLDRVPTGASERGKGERSVRDPSFMLSCASTLTVLQSGAYFPTSQGVCVHAFDARVCVF